MLPNHPSHLFPTQPSFSSLSAFHSALPGWYRITPCLISVDPREGTGQSGDTGPGKAQGRPAETIVLMPETNASALKRRGPDEPDNEPDVKRPAASKTTASPSNVVGAAAGGFGAVAGGACTWGTGGGASFGGFAGAAATGGGFGGGFAGAAAAAGGGFGGGFAGAAAAAGGGGFGAAAVLSAAAPTEKKEPVLATFGQREATTETPVSAEPAPSEDGAPTPAPTLAPSEATQSGEEDEVCIHKVRAKLFRLETRPKVVAESIPNKDDDDDDDEGESAPAAAATAAALAAAPAAAPTTDPEPEPAAGAPAGAAAAVEASGSGAEVGEGVGDDLMETRWLERGVGQVNPHVKSATWWRGSWLPRPPGTQGSGSGLPHALLGARGGGQPLRSQHVAAASLCQGRSFCASPRPGQVAHAQRRRRRGLDGAARDARGECGVACQKGAVLGAPGLACHTAAYPEARHSQGHGRARLLPMGARTPPLCPGQRRHLTPLNNQVGRLILNAPLLASTTLVERPTDNTLRLVLYSSESTSASCAKPGHFVLRVKIPAEAEALQAAINKCVSNLQK